MIVAAIGLLGPGCNVALAADARVAYLPIAFHAESETIPTTACLQVTERVYPQSAWWEDANGNGDAPERAFKAVIAAIKHQDGAALLKLSDPAERADRKEFDNQARGFFRQLETSFKLVDVPREYEFDGLSVYFARVRYEGRTIGVPFMFAHQDDGSFGFLPSRRGQLNQATYLLVEAWFNATWGPARSDSPTYCTDATVRRATHRLLVAGAGGATRPGKQTYVFVAGVPLDASGNPAGLTARIRSTVEQLKSAFATGIDDVTKHMTPEGGKRMAAWYASADQAERVRYQAMITSQSPFFVFDASPLMVVYSRSPGGSVDAMYLTVGPRNDLLWTNSSQITAEDKVFKSEASYDSAKRKPPFGNFALK
jgi:hypothetical protein